MSLPLLLMLDNAREVGYYLRTPNSLSINSICLIRWFSCRLIFSSSRSSSFAHLSLVSLVNASKILLLFGLPFPSGQNNLRPHLATFHCVNYDSELLTGPGIVHSEGSFFWLFHHIKIVVLLFFVLQFLLCFQLIITRPACNMRMEHTADCFLQSRSAWYWEYFLLHKCHLYVCPGVY